MNPKTLAPPRPANSDTIVNHWSQTLSEFVGRGGAPFFRCFCLQKDVGYKKWGRLHYVLLHLPDSSIEIRQREQASLTGGKTMTKISIQTICQLAACACVVLHSGCHLPVFNGPPGTIGAQRTRAVLNDPFPSDTLGPAFAGARPRGFDLPLPDTTGFQSHPSARRKRTYGPTGFFSQPLPPPPQQQFFPQ